MLILPNLLFFQSDVPLKKKTKTTVSGDSDSDEYDLDSDLQNVRNSQKLGDNAVESSRSEVTNVSESVTLPKRTRALKNNKDSNVTAKIQGLLDKITESSSKKSKVRAVSDDSGFSNEEDESDVDGAVSSDSFSRKTSSQVSLDTEKQVDGVSDDSDDDDSESEDEDGTLDYRSEMFKQATENFYKNQSTVSYLRKYIYGDSKYKRSYLFTGCLFIYSRAECLSLSYNCKVNVSDVIVFTFNNCSYATSLAAGNCLALY